MFVYVNGGASAIRDANFAIIYPSMLFQSSVDIEIS